VESRLRGDDVIINFLRILMVCTTEIKRQRSPRSRRCVQDKNQYLHGVKS